jgi:hypothetical protein
MTPTEELLELASDLESYAEMLVPVAGAVVPAANLPALAETARRVAAEVVNIGPNPDVTPSPTAVLADGIRYALRFCDEAGEAAGVIGYGGNLPELLRAALEEVAAEIGDGSHGLVRHRPGSWEADHVRGLAGMADWPVNT